MDNPPFSAPPGEMVTANGSHYHVRRYGANGPVILLECGLTMMSSCWGWLAPELGQFARVISYDRAGLGWSDEREGPRDVKQLAEESAQLCHTLELKTPLVLLGHSMGAMINRAAAELAHAMIWLDPAHPEQLHRRGIRHRMRNLVFYIEAAQLLATKNIPAVEMPLARHLQALPREDYRTIRNFLRDPRHLRTTAREARAWEKSPGLLREKSIGNTPVLLLSAQKNALPGWGALQDELAGLSPRTRRVTWSEMSHTSMLANSEHANKLVVEIRAFLKRLS